MQFSPYKEFSTEAVRELFTSTFADAEGASEGALIGKLLLDLMRTTPDGDLLGFVAHVEGRLAGGIFLSRLYFEAPSRVYILSPVAVKTDCQGQGLGQALIRHGIDQLRALGVNRLFTYGDPAFYAKVGFEAVLESVAQAPFTLSQPEGWLWQSLDGTPLRPLAGRPRCVAAFNHAEYW